MIIQAPINTLGYGYTGYYLTKELSKLTNISLYPIGTIDPSLTGLESFLYNKVCNNEPEVKIWHQHELITWIGKGKRFGFPIFELTHFTKQEVFSLNHCDHIIVPSHWAKRVIADHVSVPTSVVPLGVNGLIFNNLNNINREPTVFFNCGKWEKRKGHDILIECFGRAFSTKDNVELWLMCDNPFLQDGGAQWKNLCNNSPLADKIRIIPRQKTQKNVYDIIRQVDCGVFPARAEGWNLELLEVMACGKPVITTNYSAHTEFCHKNNSHLIDIDSLELAQDGIWFHGQGLWAEIKEKQKDQLINYMKQIHNSKKSSGLLTNDNGVITAREYTWENSAKKLLKYTGD